jgi:hypothetical protein
LPGGTRMVVGLVESTACEYHLEPCLFRLGVGAILQAGGWGVGRGLGDAPMAPAARGPKVAPAQGCI